MERAALDRSDKGDAEGFLEISHPDVVYFDPFLEKPIHGLEELSAYYRRGFGAEEPLAGEIVHPKIQVSGDTAVLTFNYVVKGRQSGRVIRWNATEVYRQTGDDWRIIHTHWSFLQPKLAPPEETPGA
jgi:ketosteroid isomerase-like protein